MLYFDHTRGEIQSYNLDNAEIQVQKLDFEGPNGVDRTIFSMQKMEESLFLNSAQSISMLQLGEKIKELRFDDLHQKVNLSAFETISVIPRSNWGTTKGEVFLWIKAANSHASQFTVYQDYLQILRYNIIENAWKIFNLPVPKNLIPDNERGYYNDIIPNISVKGDYLIYAFRPFPEIFVLT